MASGKRVLLLTAASLVGDYLQKVFADAGYVVTACRQRQQSDERDPLAVDLTDAASLRRVFEHTRPEIVLLCAALTNVDLCEQQPELAYAVNTAGPADVARLCAAAAAQLVFFSSDYVFDGQHGPYSEEDKPSPIDYYGRTKLEAEQAIKVLCADHLIVRTTVVYGREQAGKNFAVSLISTLSQGKQRNVPQDQYGNPTHALNLCRIVQELVSADCRGIYHVVGPDLINRYDFALEICREFGLDKGLLIPVTTAELKQPAPRPLKAGLRIDKVTGRVSTRPLGVREGLKLLKEELQWKN